MSRGRGGPPREKRELAAARANTLPLFPLSAGDRSAVVDHGHWIAEKSDVVPPSSSKNRRGRQTGSEADLPEPEMRVVSPAEVKPLTVEVIPGLPATIFSFNGSLRIDINGVRGILNHSIISKRYAGVNTDDLELTAVWRDTWRAHNQEGATNHLKGVKLKTSVYFTKGQGEMIIAKFLSSSAVRDFFEQRYPETPFETFSQDVTRTANALLTSVIARVNQLNKSSKLR